MRLKVKLLGLEAGSKVVVLNEEDAEDLGVSCLGRVSVRLNKMKSTAIVNTTTKLIGEGILGVSEELVSVLNLRDGVDVDVELAPFPTSLYFIRNKLRGRKLTYDEISEIVKDVVAGNLSEIEIASFVTALHSFSLDMNEAMNLSLAMVKTGNLLDLDKPLIVDKHSIGGVPGDKTTLLIVPIVASCGLIMPKSSSRAITSAAGTADRAEVLMPVSLTIEEMRDVVQRTNGCIIWGGTLSLTPADDIFVRVEHSLSIDPLLLPSIMSKKKAVGTDLLVIDIPCGRGTKVKTIGESDMLAKDFMELGRRLGIKVQCAVTYGEQPVGYAIGPSLEAREALRVLMGRDNIPDLLDKATDIAGILLEMGGKKNGKELALETLKSGKAERKMREMIEAQGGDSEIKPEDIVVGNHTFEAYSTIDGYLLWIDNASIVEIARLAGSPKDKGAGIIINKKVGDQVKKGDLLFEIYAEKSTKLQRALDALEKIETVGVGHRMKMMIHEVKDIPVIKKAFMLER